MQFLEDEAHVCKKTRGRWVVCNDSDGEGDEEEILSDSARDMFFDDGEVDEDLSAYVACDQLSDERTREAVQRDASAIKARHSQSKHRNSSKRQVWSAVLPLKNVAACNTKRRKMVGGRRRPLPPQQQKLAPVFLVVKKKHTSDAGVAVGAASARRHAATATHSKKSGGGCHKKGCCRPVCVGNVYWCKVHVRKEHNSMDHCKRLQQNAKQLGRERKKIVVLKALVKAKQELVLSLADAAFSSPDASTCRLCGRPRAKGIMVCEKHHKLRDLRSKVGTHTYAQLEKAVQRVDKRREQIRVQLASVKQTAVRHMSSGEISFHMRANAKRHEGCRSRCAHCGHKWTEAANAPRAQECPMCGDEDFKF